MKIQRSICVLAIGLSLHCTGENDSTTVAAPIEDTAGGGLELTINTPTMLSGHFARRDEAIEFILEHDSDEFLMSVHDIEGRELVHAALRPGLERIELAGRVSLEGPSGSLLRNAGPRWDGIRVEGELESVHALLDTPAFQLISELGPALSKRADVDTAILPVLTAFHDVASDAGPPIGAAGLRPLTAKLGAYNACSLICSVYGGGCFAAGPLFWWLCAGPSLACFADCRANYL